MPPEPQSPDDSPVRRRILRAGSVVFGRHGFAASSVETILAEAGVSRRTFYRTFRSKEAVLQELFRVSVARLLSAVREPHQDDDATQAQRVERGIEAYIAVHEKAGPLARVLLQEQFSENSPLIQQREEAMAAFSDFISATFERRGREQPDPILTRAVVAGINQVAVQMAQEYPEGNWDVPRAKRAMLLVLKALA